MSFHAEKMFPKRYTIHCCRMFTFSKLKWNMYICFDLCLVLLLMRSSNEAFVHNMKPSLITEPEGDISSLKVISYLFPPWQSIHKDKHLTLCAVQLITSEIVLVSNWFINRIFKCDIFVIYCFAFKKLTMWLKNIIAQINLLKFKC